MEPSLLQDFLPALRGAAASVLLALLTSDGPLSRQGLELLTGYSDKPIRRALITLEKVGYVALDEMNQVFWLTARAMEQFPTFTSAARPVAKHKSSTTAAKSPPAQRQTRSHTSETPEIAGNSPTIVGKSAADQQMPETYARSETPEIVGNSPTIVGKAAHDDEIPARYGGPETPEIVGNSPTIVGKAAHDDDIPARYGGSETPEIVGESPEIVGNSPTIIGESPKIAGKAAPSRARARDLAATFAAATTTDRSAEAASSKQATHARAAPDAAPDAAPEADDASRELAYWLKQGGIGTGSRMFHELLRAGLDPDYVKAHVLERLYIVRAEGQKAYGVGLLIKRLLDRDEAPPMRCEDCLRLPNAANLCGCIDKLPNVRY